MGIKAKMSFIVLLLLCSSMGFYLDAEDSENSKIGFTVNKVYISTGQRNPFDEYSSPEGNFYTIHLFGKKGRQLAKAEKAVIYFLPASKVLPKPSFTNQQINFYYHKKQFPVLAELFRFIKPKSFFVTYEEKTGPDDNKTICAKIDIFRQPAKKTTAKKREKKILVKDNRKSEQGK